VYVRARMYQPTTARWTSIDPLTKANRHELYSYVMNAVHYYIDPSGLEQIELQFNAFIHKNLGRWMWEPRSIPLFDEGRVSDTFQFRGDDRDFGEVGTSRMRFKGAIDSCSVGVGMATGAHEMGYSHRRELVQCPTCGKDYWKHWPRAKGMLLVNRVNSYFDGHCQTVIDANASGAYPFVPVPEVLTPKIDYRIVFILNALAFDRVEVCVAGQHDRFPAYEALANNKLMYQYDPKPFGHKGPTTSNLGGHFSYMMQILPGSCVTLDVDTSCKCGGSCSEDFQA